MIFSRDIDYQDQWETTRRLLVQIIEKLEDIELAQDDQREAINELHARLCGPGAGPRLP